MHRITAFATTVPHPRASKSERFVLGVMLCALALGPLSADSARAHVWPSDPGVTVTRSFTSDGPLEPGLDCYQVRWILSVEADLALEGLFASEQFPAWLNVDGVTAELNGQGLSCLHFTGEVGEVHEGLVPHRFVFDDPAGQPSLVLEAGDVLVLDYEVCSEISGQASTGYDGWSGRLVDGGPLGGWNDEAPVLHFMRDDSPLMLEDISVVSGVDHLSVIWSLSLEGESESFRLQRGESEDPSHSTPLDGEILHGPGEYRFDDYSVIPGREYRYWIAILDELGEPRYYLGPGVGSLSESVPVARLAPNFPNPFNPQTTLRFTLAEDQRVELAVYSMAGRLLRTLASGRWEAGSHDIVWDGRDAAGRELSSGTYFARLLVEQGKPEIRKLTLIR